MTTIGEENVRASPATRRLVRRRAKNKSGGAGASALPSLLQYPTFIGGSGGGGYVRLRRGGKPVRVSTLAAVFSAFVLMAYVASIVGVTLFLGTGDSSSRHLEASSGRHHHLYGADNGADNNIGDAPDRNGVRKNNDKKLPPNNRHVRTNNNGDNSRNYKNNNKKLLLGKKEKSRGSHLSPGADVDSLIREDGAVGVGAGGVHIPPSKWPVTLRDEIESNYELIEHPVLKEQVKLEVPKFWSPPIHGNGLMTRRQAMSVGTCQVPDPVTGSHVRGADCPIHQRTIFVMIASYRDYQCRETVEQIYGRAAFPERIRVAVVDQLHVDEETLVACNTPIKPCQEDPEQALCKYHHLVDVVPLDAKYSVGPVPARHVGYRMYRGEYYAMQSDAHVSFVNRWEMELIAALESTGNEMGVLSTYLSDFTDAMDSHGNSLRNERPIMCNNRWYESNGAYHLHHSVQPESRPAVEGTPQLHPWWAAGFSFARGHFVVNVPYDWYQPMVFSGEEMSVAIRGFTVGYDFYTPEYSVCFHHYAETPQGKAKRKNVPTFWENSKQFEGAGRAGMKRLLGLLHMNPGNVIKDPDDFDRTDEEIYGIGGARSTDQFYSLLGIDVAARTVQGHQCRFVDKGKMHELLVPALRPDGMGIDYDRIEYEWVDPDPEQTRREETTEPADADDSEEDEDKNKKKKKKKEEEAKLVVDEDTSESEDEGQEGPWVDDGLEEGEDKVVKVEARDEV